MLSVATSFIALTAGIVAAYYYSPRSVKRSIVIRILGALAPPPKLGMPYSSLINPHSPLRQHARNLWTVVGNLPPRNSALPCTMTVYRFPGTKFLWIHSPICLNDEVRAELEALGKVTWIVVPNRMHRTYVEAWHQLYPQAKIACPEKEKEGVEKVVKVDTACEDVWQIITYDKDVPEKETAPKSAEDNQLKTTSPRQKEPSPTAECSVCGEYKTKQEFSARQWRQDEQRKCIDCVAEYEHSKDWVAEKNKPRPTEFTPASWQTPKERQTTQVRHRKVSEGKRINAYEENERQQQEDSGSGWSTSSEETGDADWKIDQWWLQDDRKGKPLPDWEDVKNDYAFDEDVNKLEHDEQVLVTGRIGQSLEVRPRRRAVRCIRPEGCYPETQELLYVVELESKPPTHALISTDLFFNIDLDGVDTITKLLGSAGFFGPTPICKFFCIQDAHAFEQWVHESIIGIVKKEAVKVVVVAHGDVIEGDEDIIVGKFCEAAKKAVE
ncbi:uncharacterized protein SPPG_02517 [Spizellomyces punctatus DAOM BR117]|uniref:DUF4336 domain-containing protein n=1 Tax=Spizellomyces punctatus (strain DAOM BR117) TaxID=645134 RepID=A0A0L0HLS5_SPIPD|nr:uncharacterized protein SPPG_02517 [Spizellomyces punctatus DAOM BR117]KND02013.1 hypothetical protein SPPG_02517 [Spizellomyces punctatus DAOM BR117]|eukprot:XP_016610052.1 hypothetical protein SPPG_02517 [Spizellomyces punctatus DAOM BR117]